MRMIMCMCFFILHVHICGVFTHNMYDNYVLPCICTCEYVFVQWYSVMCINLHMYIHVWACVYTPTCMRACAYMSQWIYAGLYVNVCIHAYVFMHVLCPHTYMCVRHMLTQFCMVCVYVYKWHTHKHICVAHLDLYMYIYPPPPPSPTPRAIAYLTSNDTILFHNTNFIWVYKHLSLPPPPIPPHTHAPSPYIYNLPQRGSIDNI